MTASAGLCAEIRRRVGIEEVLAEHGHGPVRTSPAGATYHCPLPGHADRRPSFVVRGERWRCWSQCDRGGDVIDLLAAVEGLSNAEAVRRLGERCGLARDHTESPSPLSPRRAERLLAGFLEGRGWDPAAAAEAGLHVVLGDHGRPRVRFPCFYGAELVWWQDRAIGEALPKWLNPAGKRPALFNANSLRLAAERDGELLVVEGPSDAMAVLSTYEAPAVVGVPGAGSFSPDWTPAFSGLRRVWVVADNDGAGMKLRERVRRLLGPVVPHVVDLFVPEAHKDLDDWRRGCGTEKPELFGEALEAAFGAAEEAAAA